MRVSVLLCILAVTFVGCGGSSESKTATVEPTPETTPRIGSPKATAKFDKWLENWCDVKVGMTPGEVKAIMGEPTEAYEGEVPQFEYNAKGSGFTAFFDSDDLTYQLIYDITGKRKPGCEDVRE